jgi:outer membrane protein assembly factor BamE
MRPSLPTVLLIAAVLSACSLLYKPEIQQGDPLTPEMIAALKPGMTKRQVRLLLGSPSVNDVFHPDRWDYLYFTGRAGEAITPPPRLTLYFKDDALVRAEGPLAPAELRNAENGAPGTVAPGSNGQAPQP